jgi:acetyltransferase-like isoleucine patch superfamily enzyme
MSSENPVKCPDPPRVMYTDGCQLYSLRILDSGLVTIGNRVLIGPNVTIITERHDKDVQSRRDGIVYAQPVQIGDDCWIGVGTTILPGVTIGRGAVIGACSVVTRDIPPMSVAWGAPARVVHGVPDPDAMESEIMVTDY